MIPHLADAKTDKLKMLIPSSSICLLKILRKEGRSFLQRDKEKREDFLQRDKEKKRGFGSEKSEVVVGGLSS